MSVHLKSGIIWVAFCGSGHIIWVASLEGNNLVVFYYLGPPEIWLDSMVAFCGSGHIIWVVSLEGNNLVIFYYLGPSEIWHNMGCSLPQKATILSSQISDGPR
jgi:hypothetical protein